VGGLIGHHLLNDHRAADEQQRGEDQEVTVPAKKSHGARIKTPPPRQQLSCRVVRLMAWSDGNN
jgi:hypothetical protein